MEHEIEPCCSVEVGQQGRETTWTSGCVNSSMRLAAFISNLQDKRSHQLCSSTMEGDNDSQQELLLKTKVSLCRAVLESRFFCPLVDRFDHVSFQWFLKRRPPHSFSWTLPLLSLDGTLNVE